MIRLSLPAAIRDYYDELDYTSWDMSKVEKLKEINFLLFKLSLYRIPDAFPVEGKAEPIYMYYFSTGKKRPTVNCTDILGGTMKYNEETKKASTNYPIAFINAIACVLFKRWNAFTVCTNNKGMFDAGDTPEHFQEQLENVAYNNIQATQFVKTLPTTDVDNLYTIGVSLGALTMAAMYSIDDSYKKAVIIIGGWPLYEIICNSDEGMVKGFWERMLKLYDGDIVATKEIIAYSIAMSNGVYAYGPGEGILQIRMEEGDTSVPSEFQKLYTDLVKPKEVVKLKYRKWIKKPTDLQNGHYQTLLYYPYLVYRSLKFLARRGGV